MPLLLRAEMKKHNKHLAGFAKQSGVVQPLDYAIFMDHGYRGLYGGLGMRDVHERKRLQPKPNILDHMAARNWWPICFVPRRPRKNSAAKTCGTKTRPTGFTTTWAAKSAAPSTNSSAPCRKIVSVVHSTAG